MELVLTSANSILRLLMMVSVGVIGARVGIIDKKATDALIAVIVNITLPCTLFSSYMMEYDKEQFQGFLISIVLGIISHALSIVVANATFKKSRPDCDIERVSSVVGNCGFIGIPICDLMFGSEGVLYLTAFMSASSICTWTYSYMSICDKKFSVKTVCKSLMSLNNMAVFGGLICYLIRVPFPEFFTSTLTTVGSCTTPLGMLISGSVLARANIKELVSDKSNFVVCLLKLIADPLVTIPFVLLLTDNIIIGAVVIVCAATPMANMTVVFSQMAGKNPERASGLFAMTTLLSMFTIPFMVFIYNLTL